ncbi:CurL C-terminal domain-containing protein, partial [Klebsiella pneumoniae]
PAVRDDHDQVRAPVFIPLSAPSFEQLDELTQQLTPLLATLDASTLAYTQQVARPVFDCRRVIQVENDGTQAMLASLDNLMPDAPWGLHCPD